MEVSFAEYSAHPLELGGRGVESLLPDQFHERTVAGKAAEQLDLAQLLEGDRLELSREIGGQDRRGLVRAAKSARIDGAYPGTARYPPARCACRCPTAVRRGSRTSGGAVQDLATRDMWSILRSHDGQFRVRGP